jgi:hypothetical protein
LRAPNLFQKFTVFRRAGLGGESHSSQLFFWTFFSHSQKLYCYRVIACVKVMSESRCCLCQTRQWITSSLVSIFLAMMTRAKLALARATMMRQQWQWWKG